MDSKEHYLKILQQNPTDGRAFAALAHCIYENNEKRIMLTDGRVVGTHIRETVTLADGRIMDVKQLYTEAIINHHTTDPVCFINLTELMEPNETVTLANGWVMTRRDLLLESVNYSNAEAYYFLAHDMKDNERVTLPDGCSMTKIQLFLESLSNGYARAYCELAYRLRTGQTIVLLDGREMNNIQLLLEAIAKGLNPYRNLARAIAAGPDPTGTVTLHDGREMNQRQLCIEALKHHPHAGFVYYDLARLLWPRETITLPDGRIMDDKQLCVEAIRLDTKHARPYRYLAALVKDPECVRLDDGRVMDAAQLFAESVRLCSSSPSSRCSFSSSSSSLVSKVTETPHEYLCPITGEIMEDPVATEDGHVYDRSAITKWWTVSGHHTSPMTNKRVDPIVVPVIPLRSMIAKFKTSLVQ